jgi:hypothetical protein
MSVFELLPNETEPSPEQKALLDRCIEAIRNGKTKHSEYSIGSWATAEDTGDNTIGLRWGTLPNITVVPFTARDRERIDLEKKYNFTRDHTKKVIPQVEELVKLGASVHEVSVIMGTSLVTARQHIGRCGKIKATKCPSSEDIIRKRHEALLKVLPDNIALLQAQWELRQSVLRARRSGATVHEICNSLKVTNARIYQITQQAENRARRPSPMEEYLSNNSDIWRIYDMKKAAEHKRAREETKRQNAEALERAELARLKAKYDN